MAIYDSNNLINWPIKNFIKQLLIDILTVLIMILLAKAFILDDVTWIAWIIYAIKISLISIVLIFVINYVFYRPYINKIFAKIKR